MRLLLWSTSLVALGALNEPAAVEEWMQHAFYPVLLGILVIASLGLPIPEDIPLIAAGVLLHTHPGIASWPGTLGVALLGIMSGDLVLYTFGRRWGQDVLSHRSVRWLLTPDRFEWFKTEFHRHGMWCCFVGRFFLGIRAAMCLSAGATRFPYWRFFLADFAGALLSVPLFVWLGFWFAGMIPTLRAYLVGVQGILFAAGAAALAGLIVYYKFFKRRRRAAAHGPVAADATAVDSPRAATPPVSIPAPVAPSRGATPFAAEARAVIPRRVLPLKPET